MDHPMYLAAGMGNQDVQSVYYPSQRVSESGKRYPSTQSCQFQTMPRSVHHADITHGDSINVIA